MEDPSQAAHEHAQTLAARSLGIVMIGVGSGVCVLNVVLIALLGIYFGGLFVIGLPAVFIGAWTLLTGRTHSARFQTAPRWWTAGFYTSLMIGLLSGLALAVWIPKIAGAG